MTVSLNTINTLTRQLSQRAAQPLRSVIGFSRLKRTFTQGMNYKNYDQFISTTKNKIIGNLPTDILAAAIKSNDKQKTILQIQSAFGKAVKNMSSVDDINLVNATSCQVNLNAAKDYIKLFCDYDFEGIEKVYTGVFKQTTAAGIKETQKAADILKKAMKELLPQDADIKINYLGNGLFSKTYKVEFLNSKGEKIFKDLVIKAYTDMNKRAEVMTKIQMKFNKKIQGLTEEEIRDLIKQTQAYKSMKEDDISKFIKMLKSSANATEEKIMEANKLQFMMDSHGVAAEANSYTRIKKMLGHKIKDTNFNEQYMFDLENKFSLSPFIESSLPHPKKNINFDLLGTITTDIESNSENIIAGRIIDCGGIFTNRRKLLDKVVLKHYKKIMNRHTIEQQKEMIKRLKELVKNPKTPHRDKILTAIECAEEEIQMHNTMPIANNLVGFL